MPDEIHSLHREAVSPNTYGIKPDNDTKRAAEIAPVRQRQRQQRGCKRQKPGTDVNITLPIGSLLPRFTQRVPVTWGLWRNTEGSAQQAVASSLLHSNGFQAMASQALAPRHSLLCRVGPRSHANAAEMRAFEIETAIPPFFLFMQDNPPVWCHFGPPRHFLTQFRRIVLHMFAFCSQCA